MGLYSAFRRDGVGPTLYEPNPTPWAADMVESGLAFAFVIIAVSFYAILPGIPGKEKWFVFIRVTVSLFIGAAILVTQVCQSWEVGSVTANVQYKAGARKELHGADIGLHIGLHGINITLAGNGSVFNETIDYNDHFSWEWAQGRIGFGPYAGRINREFREAQYRGLPYPILWIAEIFTFDGDGIRWGRHYRWGGFYAHIMLWLSFCMWVLANILFFILLSHGAYLLMMTGGSMIIACVLFAGSRNDFPLEIPLGNEVLKLSYGWGFVLCLIGGILALILGLIIYLMDIFRHDWVSTFFGIDPLDGSDDDVILDTIEPQPHTSIHEEVANGDVGTSDEGSKVTQRHLKAPSPGRGVSFTPDEVLNDDEVYINVDDDQPKYVQRKSRFTKRFQKSRRTKRPAPPPRPPRNKEPEEEEDYELYANAPAIREEIRLRPLGHENAGYED